MKSSLLMKSAYFFQIGPSGSDKFTLTLPCLPRATYSPFL
jgi:hypothetical protein